MKFTFFKKVKPTILGKLIHYNKLYRIETACPVDSGDLNRSYYALQLKILTQECKEHITNSAFYRYYRSGRTDKDEEYYLLGHINYHDGLNSYVFEIDAKFSTYFDYKVAKIIANELTYRYLTSKLSPEQNSMPSCLSQTNSLICY